MASKSEQRSFTDTESSGCIDARFLSLTIIWRSLLISSFLFSQKYSLFFDHGFLSIEWLCSLEQVFVNVSKRSTGFLLPSLAIFFVGFSRFKLIFSTLLVQLEHLTGCLLPESSERRSVDSSDSSKKPEGILLFRFGTPNVKKFIYKKFKTNFQKYEEIRNFTSI